MKIREIDVRRFRKILRDSGYTLDRMHGSHEIWKTQSGQVFSFPSVKKTVPSGIVWNFSRLIGRQLS